MLNFTVDREELHFCWKKCFIIMFLKINLVDSMGVACSGVTCQLCAPVPGCVIISILLVISFGGFSGRAGLKLCDTFLRIKDL